ncbi:MAG: threonine synthase [Chloroflexota bacterium]|nr:MAG: threonine synthase [Chloroflexota bacterium]
MNGAPFSYLTGLECTNCGLSHDADAPNNVCRVCGKVLYARYDLASARRTLDRDCFRDRPADLWRYHELLPIRQPDNVITLGEGVTPLLRMPRLGESLGLKNLWMKDESLNPTGSFKARGMAVAVSRARELGLKRLAAPSAGNAGAALATYAARAGLEAWIFMPADTPRVPLIECRLAGARAFVLDGLINDAGRIVRSRSSWFDVSTLREPYRVEGKKTMGYELAEQFAWSLPDAIIYPTGGGTGLVGMVKAFDEMETLGWIGSKRPRMYSVQSSGCAPIVRAFEAGRRDAPIWENARTIASGLRVPAAIGDYLMLDAIRRTDGVALAVDDDEIMAATDLVAVREGAWLSPEGAATICAAQRLREDGTLKAHETVVLFNTGGGMVYPDLQSATLPRVAIDGRDVPECDP